uniref:ER membrane protein complex subunit 10 n=1 Tax=Coccolithus braarudii TaxID=221442 RepID=A0A7S0LBJ8_9EUKA
MRSHILSVLLIALHVSAFDFDDEEEEVASASSTFFTDETAGASTLPLLHRIGAGDFVNRSKVFYQDGKHLGSVSARISQAKLAGNELEAFQALLKTGGFYTLSLPSVVGDDKSQPVTASISVCALMASRFEEHIHVTLASNKRILGLSYTVPKVPASCPSSGLPKIALDEVLFNTSLTISLPAEAPKPHGKVADAGFLPPSAAAAAARNQAAEGGDGEGAPPPPPQSFLTRYWMYILPVVLIMTFGGGPEPEKDGKAAEGANGGGSGSSGGGSAGGGGGGGGGRAQSGKRK